MAAYKTSSPDLTMHRSEHTYLINHEI